MSVTSIVPAFAPAPHIATSLTLEVDVRPRTAENAATFHALAAQSIADLARTTRSLRAVAARNGQQVAFSLPLHPVMIDGQNEPRGLLERLGLPRAAAGAIVQVREGAIGLVGTPEQIANTILAYYDIGIEHFVLHGLDDAGDAARYATDLIPLVRHKVARRDAILNILAG